MTLHFDLKISKFNIFKNKYRHQHENIQEPFHAIPGGPIRADFFINIFTWQRYAAGITKIAVSHNIKAAWIQFLGALKQGKLVSGPEKAELPPVPVWQEFSRAWEIIGVGNLFWEGDSPRLHVQGRWARAKTL